MGIHSEWPSGGYERPGRDGYQRVTFSLVMGSNLTQHSLGMGITSGSFMGITAPG